jgi:peptide/nickel transport system permease protein
MMVLILWVLAACLAPWLPLQPNTIHLANSLAAPDQYNWLGTDDLGRSIADRLLMGAQTALLVSFGVVILAAGFGMVIGGLAALIGGWFDQLLAYVLNLVLAFPGLLLAITLAGLLGPGIDNLIIALAAVGWVSYARLARAQILSLKKRDHIAAAQILGVSRWRMLWRHLLPFALAPLIVEATFNVAAVIIAEAGLSFLGLGTSPPTASWGTMIRDGVAYLLVAPHLVLAPGFTLFVIVLAINLLGDQLRDWLAVQAA